jgi:glycine cleavage system regulatory protein
VPHDPSTVDFGTHRLSKDLPDDWLLASIIEFRDENTSAQILLATDDGGLQLKAPAHGIKSVALPADKRLPDEPDEVEKENRKLREENTALKNAKPQLMLRFMDDSSILNAPVTVEIPVKVQQDELEYEDEIAKEKERKAKFGENKNQNSGSLRPLQMEPVGPWHKTKNPKYGEQLAKYMAQLACTYELSFKLSNVGNAVARNVEVHLDFEEVAMVTRALPEPPQRVHDRLEGAFNSPSLAGLIHKTVQLSIDGMRARWAIDLITHNIPITLGPILIVTVAPTRPFRVKSTIHSADLLTPVTGILKVEFTTV